MLLKYNLENSPESVWELIKAANTNTVVQFEQGERCRVIFPDLTAEAKLDLLNKIEQVGIDFMYRYSVNKQQFTLQQSTGFFYSKTFRIKVFSEDVSQAALFLKDRTRYDFTFKLLPLVCLIPQSKKEEAQFIAAGGEIKQRYCTLL